jgi:hypothetical protein
VQPNLCGQDGEAPRVLRDSETYVEAMTHTH